MQYLHVCLQHMRVLTLWVCPYLLSSENNNNALLVMAKIWEMHSLHTRSNHVTLSWYHDQFCIFGMSRMYLSKSMYVLYVCSSSGHHQQQIGNAWLLWLQFRELKELYRYVCVISSMTSLYMLQVCSSSGDHKRQMGNAWLLGRHCSWGSNWQRHSLPSHLLCQAQQLVRTPVWVLRAKLSSSVMSPALESVSKCWCCWWTSFWSQCFLEVQWQLCSRDKT